MNLVIQTIEHFHVFLKIFSFEVYFHVFSDDFYMYSTRSQEMILRNQPAS